MGKKSDKSTKEKPVVQSTEEVANKTPEPYSCMGNFATDFRELCREQFFCVHVPIIVQNKKGVPTKRFSVDPSATSQALKKGIKEDKKPMIPHQTDFESSISEEREIMNHIGFYPRTFTIKPTYSALKPAIFIETENADKSDNVTELSIRRWKVDLKFLGILEHCLTNLSKLSTLTFWRVGLTSEAISKLADLLAKTETIKSLTVENNEEAKDENYNELLKPGNNLTKLHLRYCNITPVGAKKIADELGTLSNTGNTKLLVLDLSGCRLGDFGAIYISKALRMNRTLVSLSLNSCDIGDETCAEMAKTISRYVLSDEEILCRRQILSERNFAEASKSVSRCSKGSIWSSDDSAPVTRKGDPKDRPVSVRSSSKDKRERFNSTKGKKEGKEEKHDKTTAKGKKDDKTANSKKVSSVFMDLSKAAKSKGGRSAKQGKILSQTETMSDTISENLDSVHPLLNKVEAVEPGKLLISGNFVLLMLNLARNRITEEGLEEFDTAISYQTFQMSSIKVNGTGLLRLNLQSNQFENSNDTYQNIQRLLSNRHNKSRNTNFESE